MGYVGRSRHAVWAAVVAVVTVLVTGLVLGSADAASATQPDSSKWWTYVGDCANDAAGTSEHVLIMRVPGSGPMAPYMISGNRVLNPYWVRYNLFSGETGQLKSRHNGYLGVPVAKPAAIPASAVRCEFTGQVLDQGELIDFTATVIGVMHGGNAYGRAA
jgi:hypothetical protein